MLGTSERNEDRAVRHRVTRSEQRHVAGCLPEYGGELLVGSCASQELVGDVGEQEVDVELSGKPSQLLSRRRGGERRRARYDTARFQCGPAPFEPRRRGLKLRRVWHEPGEDQRARRVSRERLGHCEQRVDARLVLDGDENRALHGLADLRRSGRREVQRRLVPKDGPLKLLELGARFDPQLVDEGSARIPVGAEGLRLPTRPVQRRHQIPAQAFAERFFGDERLELSHQLVVAAEC